MDEMQSEKIESSGISTIAQWHAAARHLNAGRPTHCRCYLLATANLQPYNNNNNKNNNGNTCRWQLVYGS